MPLGNSIGGNVVRNWFGSPPEKFRQSVQILEYPGVDHQAIRLLGERSPIFQLESVVDVLTLAAGRTLYATYCGMVGNGSQQLYWNGVNLDTEFLNVVVLDVRIIELAARALICGGITGGAAYDLRVQWSLMLTEYP